MTAGGQQSYIGSKAHFCSNCLQTIRLKRNLVSIKLSVSPVLNKPSPSSYELPRAWLACGSSRGSATKQGRCWVTSMGGSQRVLIQRICKTPRHYWRSRRRGSHDI